MAANQDPKQAFQECWQQRTNTRAFVNCLLRKLGSSPADSVWTKDSRGVRPTFRERARLRAILDAWAGYIDGNYMDHVEVLRFPRNIVTEGRTPGWSDIPEVVRRTYNRLTMPSSRYVKTVKEGLEQRDWVDPERSGAERVSRYAGDAVWKGWSIDSYFNLLLEWEERHIYQTIDWVISSTIKATGGRRGIDIVVQAVRQWLNEQKVRPKDNIYKRYAKHGILKGQKY